MQAAANKCDAVQHQLCYTTSHVLHTSAVSGSSEVVCRLLHELLTPRGPGIDIAADAGLPAAPVVVLVAADAFVTAAAAELKCSTTRWVRRWHDAMRQQALVHGHLRTSVRYPEAEMPALGGAHGRCRYLHNDRRQMLVHRVATTLVAA
jgi:hypothetical protein